MISHRLFPSFRMLVRPLAGLFAALSLALPLRAGPATELPPLPPLTIVLTADHHAIVDGKSVPVDRLEATLRAAGFAGLASRTFRLSADKTVPYATLMEVLDILNDHRMRGSDLPGPGYREQVERFGHPAQ